MSEAVVMRSGDPPGPGRWRSWVPIWEWRTDRIAPIERTIRRYGDFVLCKLGPARLYLLNDPELIEECLVTRHRDFHKDPYYSFLNMVLGKGLLTSEDDFHLRQRRMIQPAFHRQRIHAYGEWMVHYARDTASRWTAGQRVSMAHEMMHVALAIVGKTLFNSEIAGDAEKVAHALDTILPMDNLFIAPLGPILKHLPLPPTLRFKRAIRDLDEVLYRMIREHEAAGDQGDLLSMLLAAQDEDDGAGMTRQQVRNEALTLFLAGHETTAIALTWTWYLLSQNPEAETKLHAELDAILAGREPTPGDYPRLDYTRRVFTESMRLYPPAYMIGRQAITETSLGGYRIPKGAMVIMAPAITHRDPRLFPDPERFDPDRWLPERSEDRHKFAYFPFGGGRRLCIGEPFAWMEGVLVLATIAQRWSARLEPGHTPGLDPRVTLRPKGGMPMTVHPRA